MPAVCIIFNIIKNLKCFQIIFAVNESKQPTSSIIEETITDKVTIMIIGFLAVLLAVGVLPLSILIYLSKIKTKKMDTLLKVIELGGNVDPEMMNLLNDYSGYKIDYKYGLIWLAIGIPLTLGLWMEEGLEVAVFATIPVFIGVAFLISGKYKLRESS